MLQEQAHSALNDHRSNPSFNSLDQVGAILLVIILTPLTIQAREDLSAYTDPLADFELGDGFADMGDLADDLVTGTDPVGRHRSPSTRDGVNIRSADSTTFNRKRHVMWSSGLELVLLYGELCVVFGIYMARSEGARFVPKFMM